MGAHSELVEQATQRNEAGDFQRTGGDVATKPMFRSAFKRNRCITPASGYYEWKTTSAGKQRYYFTSKEGAILSIAGIWDEWQNPETGKPLRSCSMMITEPNKVAAKVHDRMPVLLVPNQFESWLSGKAGTEILRPAPDRMLTMRPVSTRVNSSRADDSDATLIDAVAV